MELSYLINTLRVIQVTGEVERKDITAVEFDSRKCKKNTIFVALKGANEDGHRYIMQAMSQGAAAVVIEDNKAIPDEMFIHAKVTKILVPESRKALASLSRALYSNPDEKLNLIGITGTNGKTTTAFIIRHLLEQTGNKCGIIGTILVNTGAREIEAQLTTPQANELAFYFDEMVSAGCSSAVMEVSSHALKLGRTEGFKFRTAIFSNITADHFDFHKTFEDYFASKKILFDSLTPDAVAVTNIDDPHGREIVSGSQAQVVSYGMAAESDFRIENVVTTLDGCSFSLVYRGNSYTVKSGLIGLFNVYNLTAAIAGVTVSGMDIEKAVNAATTVSGVPGRFQVVTKNDIRIVVDYSHTADSLEKALQNLKQISDSETKIVTVFGCGGDRDKTKRPGMGKIAEHYSDRVIVTSDNPRTENPDAIIADITAGMQSDKYVTIADRRKAIETAISSATGKTAILIAGKGHEDYQIIGKEKIHFSDLETAREILERVQ